MTFHRRATGRVPLGPTCPPWSRGIQDIDYVELARSVPGAADDVAAIVDAMVPEVLWELGVQDPNDPSYVHSDISWSTDPNLWEQARSCLADIITDYAAYQSTPHYLGSLGTGGCQLICDDGELNGQETDVDCGGMICGACGDGGQCSTSQDCVSSVCEAGVCVPATCEDGVKNQGETQPDCGGPACPNCHGESCGIGFDCISEVCSAGVCQAPTCADATKNQDETDVDCGGPTCGQCGIGQLCSSAGDCASGICTQGQCQAPSCADGIQNQGETQVDCGGANCPNCDGETCSIDTDCQSLICYDGTCGGPSCDDGLKNGDEGDVDCGGGCTPCPDNSTCNVSADCESKRCIGGTCWPPSCVDWVQNGTETGFDCGGSCPSLRWRSLQRRLRVPEQCLCERDLPARVMHRRCRLAAVRRRRA